MAITDVPAFAHLTDADIDNLAFKLDAIRQDIEDSRGARDARYIRRTIAAQRALEVAGRLMLAASSRRSAWWAGTVTLGVAKIIENMEIGHNVMHGQWDWMNDPEIHSSTWEWDMGGAAKHWRFTHNFMHHKYTNILGMDDDVGYGLLRVTRDEKWKPFNLGNTATQLPPYDFESTVRLESYFAQVSADLWDQLFLTAALRNDGASTFGPENRRNWYPKASAAWTFHRGEVGENKFLTYGKLRAAYGQSGTQPAPYLLASTLVTCSVSATSDCTTVTSAPRRASSSS